MHWVPQETNFVTRNQAMWLELDMVGQKVYGVSGQGKRNYQMDLLCDVQVRTNILSFFVGGNITRNEPSNINHITKNDDVFQTWMWFL